MTETTLTKHKLVFTEKIAVELLDEIQLMVGRESNDFLNDLFTMRIQATLLGMKEETKVLTYYAPKPSFLDWLLGRSKPFKVVIYTRDIVKHPIPGNFVRLTDVRIDR